MKNIVFSFFDSCKWPLLLYAGSFILMLLSLYCLPEYFVIAGLRLFMFSFLLLLIAFIVQLFKRQRIDAILLFVPICFTFLCVWLVISNILLMFDSGHDTFADGLIIPKNISISEPREDFEADTIRKKEDIELYDGGQGGIYNYRIWLKNIEPGMIYLKVYEVTHNDILSEEDVRIRTEQPIPAVHDTLKALAKTDAFTIYEGDWEYYYAARFEVWFRPENGNAERKLLQKTYKIQGWMR